MKKVIFKILVISAILLLLSPYPSSSKDDVEEPIGDNVIYVLKVRGSITEGTYLQIIDGLREAEQKDAQALLIEIDTPGGLVSSTLAITEKILNSEIPVITYVTPRGAIAASAGTFILIASHIAAMSPGTTIGAAMPVTVSPEGLTEANEKTIKFFAGHIESIAASRGRNASQARLFVTENAVLNESMALERGVIDFIAEDEKELLDKIDGFTVKIRKENRTLTTKNATIIIKSKNIRSLVLEMLSNPQIAIILLIVGMYGLIFGFMSPGTYVPEMIGAICLILSLYGMGLFNVNIFGAILIALAIILFIAEALTPTFGILTVGAIICLIIGGLILPREPLLLKHEWLEGFILTIIGIAISSAAFFLFALSAVLKTRKKRAKIGAEELIGKIARAETDITDEGGLIKIRGEIWKARTMEKDKMIRKGEKVEVVRREGLTLIVKKA